MIKKILMCGLFGLLGCAHSAPIPVQEHLIYDAPIVAPAKTITWRPFKQASIESTAQNKMLVLFFYDSSDASKAIKNKVLTNSCVVDQMEKNYIFSSIDTEKYPGVINTLSSINISVPSIIFILPNKEVIPLAFHYMAPEIYCELLKKFYAEYTNQSK